MDYRPGFTWTLNRFNQALAGSDPTSLGKLAFAAATYKKGVSLFLALQATLVLPGTY